MNHKRRKEDQKEKGRIISGQKKKNDVGKKSKFKGLAGNYLIGGENTNSTRLLDRVELQKGN